MNKYSEMQKAQYESDASQWTVDNRDPVVGGFDQHNEWPDYDEYLFKDIIDLDKKVGIDFGCGPGRNLVKYSDSFKELHGVDIAQKNIDNAATWLKHNSKNLNKHKLFVCNGVDISAVPSKSYDVVMSTICFQHICVYNTRVSLIEEFGRVLKPGGYLTMQMGFGPQVPTKASVGYYDNFVDAAGTNGQMDTRVENPETIQRDLINAGFEAFKYYIRETGPGDGHPNWIFFNARKI